MKWINDNALFASYDKVCFRSIDYTNIAVEKLSNNINLTKDKFFNFGDLNNNVNLIDDKFKNNLRTTGNYTIVSSPGIKNYLLYDEGNYYTIECTGAKSNPKSLYHMTEYDLRIYDIEFKNSEFISECSKYYISNGQKNIDHEVHNDQFNIYFYEEFNVTNKIESAILKIFTNSIPRVEINGVKIVSNRVGIHQKYPCGSMCNGALSPFYKEYDLKKFIFVGKNRIKITLGTNSRIASGISSIYLTYKFDYIF